METEIKVTNPEIITTLFRIASSRVQDGEIFRWYADNKERYTEAAVRRTLRQAGKADVLDFLIPETDITKGATVKSRSTARVGRVLGIHPDGCTIDVRWDSGGVQALSKESVFIVKSADNHCDIKKVTTENDPYAGMRSKDKKGE